MSKNLAVTHFELHLGHVFNSLLKRTILLQQVKDLIFGQRKISINRTVIGYGHQRFGNTAVHQCSYLVRDHAGHTVDRAFDFSIGQIVTGIDFLGFSLRQSSLGFGLCIPRRLKIVIRHDILLMKLFFASGCQPCRSQFGFRCFHIGPCRLQGSLVRNLINHKQHLPFPDGGTFINTNAGNRAAYLRTDLYMLAACYRCGII